MDILTGLKKPKRLIDQALECAVYNFNNVFLDFDSKSRKHSVKKAIILPCHVFENIICKSKEMPWIIPFHQLRPCLSARDVLGWENIDLTPSYFYNTITECDLKDTATPSTNIRSLSIYGTYLDSETLNCFSKLKGLQNLEIKGNPLSYRNRIETLADNRTPKKIKFTNLKKLTIDCRDALNVNFYEGLYKGLDLEGSKDSLELLVLEGRHDVCNNQLIQSIGSFRNLKYLHLRYLDLSADGWLFRELKKLKRLKTLDLSHSLLPEGCRTLLRDVLYNVTSIENLDVSNTGLKQIRKLSRRKLKYLGKHFNINYDKLYNYDIDSLLTLLEESVDNKMLCIHIMATISNGFLKSNWVADSVVIERLERILPKIYQNIDCQCDVEEIVSIFNNNVELRQQLLMKLSLIFASSFLLKFKSLRIYVPHMIITGQYFFPQFLAHIEKGTNAVKSILQVIPILTNRRYNWDHEEYLCKLRELGAVEILEKLLDNKEFNEEAKSILDKF